MSKSRHRWSEKSIIGLTGNIATGKSTVMKMAADRGALTLDADQVVHDIMDNDRGMQAAIGVTFGDEVQLPDGRIDRQRLGAIVFNDAEALRDLEQLLHPAVRLEILRQIDESAALIIVIEAIKLLEGELAPLCDQIWVTRCSRQRQLDRLIICRGLDKVTAAQRIDVQPPQEAKVARADVVIDTNSTLADTEAQFEMAWGRLPQAPARTVAATPATAAGSDPKRPAATTAPSRPRDQTTTAAATAKARTTAGPIKRQKETAALDTTSVRRARPSDIPAILLLIHKATNGAVKMKRADLLMALSERSYLIGQAGTEISTVLGWNTDSMIARIDRIYIHPLSEAAVTGPAVLAEVEKSANELICEIILAFPPADSPSEITMLFADQDYELVTNKDQLKRVWRAAVDESQPDDTFIMLKVLRDARIA